MRIYISKSFLTKDLEVWQAMGGTSEHYTKVFYTNLNFPQINESGLLKSFLLYETIVVFFLRTSIIDSFAEYLVPLN